MTELADLCNVNEFPFRNAKTRSTEVTLLKILADDKIKRVEYRNISNFIYIDLLCLPEFKQGP